MGIRFPLFQTKMFPRQVSGPRAVLLTPPGINMHRKKFKAISNTPLVVIRQQKIIITSEGHIGPMARVIFADGTASRWHQFQFNKRKVPVAIETCAPDEYGRLRFAQLKVR